MESFTGSSEVVTQTVEAALVSSVSVNEEKAPDSSENVQKPKVLKAKKRKKPKDSTAPRVPLTGKFAIRDKIQLIVKHSNTGYMRYLNDRREAVRTANPNFSFAEITKILASEWSNLPADKKQQYLDAAEQDRERYTKEYNAYKQTEAYKQFAKQQSEKKIKESKDKEDAVKIPTPVSFVLNKVTKTESFTNYYHTEIMKEEILRENTNYSLLIIILKILF